MAQSQPFRLQAKRVNRVAGWLLAVLVGFFWVMAVVFALLSIAVFLQKGIIGLAVGLVTGLICLLAILLTGKVHDALAVYEFTFQGVSKRSPFREQRANWLEVAEWAIAESDGIWWLLNKEGQVLLSLEWLYFPDEEVPAAKAFIVEHLCCISLSPPSVAQPFLSRFQNFRRLILRVRFSFYASVLGYWLVRRLGEDLIATIVALVILMLAIVMLAGILLSGGNILLFGRAKFLVCGDQLIKPDSGFIIHLPSVRRLERTSDGITLVGADGQTISIPSHLTALWDYLRTRLPSVGDLEEQTSSEHK